MSPKGKGIFVGLASVVITITTAACNSSSGGGGGTSEKSGTTTDPSKTTLKVASLAFETLTPTNIYTSDAGSNNCASFSVLAKTKTDEAVPNTSIAMSLVGVTAETLKEYGVLSSPITTDAAGRAKGSFCAANKVADVILIAESDSIKANSGEISITLKPEYSFAYRNSDFDIASPKPTETLRVNLFDSGPYDCGNLNFRLTKLNSPVKDVAIKFRSDFGYPAGAKLRTRASSDTPYEIDATSLNKYLSFTATSDNDGVFKVPFCGGQVPGSLLVYASYTDEYGKLHNAKTPPISVSSGTANLTSMGLTFDSTNARTLKALFNNEAPSPLEFILKISSVFGGALSVSNPVYIHAESGTLNVTNGGIPDDTGAVKFSMSASYNGSTRPTPVRLFNNASAQSVCNPEAIAKELNTAVNAGSFKIGSTYTIDSAGTTNFVAIGAANNSPGTPFVATGAGSGTGTAKLALTYSELAINWRSTLTYTLRGQEPFNDYNRDGKYNTGGDGFWDKDQDGAYTQGVDAVTHFGVIPGGAACRCLDPTTGLPNATAPTQGPQNPLCIESIASPSCFRRSSEWFIDLPTPFVDANENGIYEATLAGQDMDRLIGDVYDEPNGKRDVDTLIWKSTTLPIYTGTSPYAMVRSAIQAGSILNPSHSPSATETLGTANYFKDLVSRNLMASGELSYLSHAQEDLDAGTNMRGNGASGFSAWRWVSAQGICGTPVPGGSTVSATTRLISELYGSRTVTTHFYMQDGDEILDPSRRLLTDGTGGSSAKINFNIPDHPAGKAGYPIKYEIKVPPCTRAVPNGVGVWCSAASYFIDTKMDSDTVTLYMSIPEYKSVANPCTITGYSVEKPGTGSCEAPTTP